VSNQPHRARPRTPSPDCIPFARMTDFLTRKRRSALMSKIRGKNTRPEMVVRRLLHTLGYRFRLHQRSLPGSPDIVFARVKKVIFVNGCFWHRHNCGRAYSPKTRAGFWAQKFEMNVTRDRRDTLALRRAGWSVLVIWECQTVTPPERLARRLVRFLGPRGKSERASPQAVRRRLRRYG
jgi:DNA mismatch endonuclease (patch repair protein)